MKKLIFISLLVLAFSSCEKFLEEQPTALVSDATFYKTYDQSIIGLATAYAAMRGEGEGNNWKDGDNLTLYNQAMPSDICTDGPYFEWLWSTTSHPQAPYGAYYKVIAEANVAIEKARINEKEIDASLPTSNASQLLKDSDLAASKIIEGEARFIRGLMYFKLVSYYGDVPLILKSFVSGDIPTDLVRAPKDSVYALARSDMQFAEKHCATKEMVPSGRVTQGVAAGMLAKLDLYWASITLRDEKYWDRNLLPSQPENKENLRAELYAEAIGMCSNVINGDYGNYVLETYYPAAATGAYFSNEHLLALHSVVGDHTKAEYHGWWAGNRGRQLSHYAPFLWDFPTWEEQWDSPKKIYDLGQEGLNDLLVANEWTLTGDTTRRMWSCLIWRGNPDPPQTQYWTVYEPLARFMGEDFFAQPGLGAAPYENYPEHTRTVLNDNNGSWTDQIWTAAGRQLTDPEIWRIDNSPHGYTSGKFRLNWPYGEDWEEDNYDHTLPVLRLAEIYLLRAEANFFLANEVLTNEVIADIDVVRERAQNQAPLKELMLFGGKQSASGIIKADDPKLFRDILPAGISGDRGLKILLDERVRELSNENNTRWFDLVRFPQIIIPNMHEMSLQEQPLKSGIGIGDNYYTTSYFMADRFGVESNLYMLYLPLPESEVEFYPGLTQTYGYY
jgi:hypothetical protein